MEQRLFSLDTRPLPLSAEGSVETALAQRRSERQYAGQPISLKHLARVLHYADGVTAPEPARRFRSAPSAGAPYPVDLYVCAFDARGLESGVYHYLPEDDALEPRRVGDVHEDLSAAALAQGSINDAAAVVLALTGTTECLTGRYGSRSERYMLLEAGNIGQSVYLEAAALGLGCCAVGAFEDDAVARVRGVDGQRDRAFYLLPPGVPR